MLVEQYLTQVQGEPGPKISVRSPSKLKLPAPTQHKALNDPKQFRFKPPGTTDDKKYVKGIKPKFKRKPLVVEHYLDYLMGSST